jgi:GH25 family lysozyme M1 (1,4-beta-N-acetylmuramidase)
VAEGLDLYTKYQSVTDFGAVARAGYSFAYFKGTDGTTVKDTADWPARAHAAGMKCGLYAYAQPGTAADQYRLLLSTARARGAVDLAPALDLESPFVPGPTATAFAIAFLKEAVNQGQLPVFYANDSMMTYTLPAVRAAVPTVFPWIARYGKEPVNSYRLWQHSSSGQVPGITASAVDLNTGEVPGAPTATPQLEDKMGPQTIAFGPGNKDASGKSIRQWHHATIETNKVSQIVGVVWFAVSSGYNNITDFNLYFNGAAEPIHVDTLLKDQRYPWTVPDGCQSISWDYLCDGPSSACLIFLPK